MRREGAKTKNNNPIGSNEVPFVPPREPLVPVIRVATRGNRNVGRLTTPALGRIAGTRSETNNGKEFIRASKGGKRTDGH